MAIRDELQDRQGPRTTQRQQEQRQEGTGDHGRKNSQMSGKPGNRGNAGSHQGDRDTSAPPAPGHTRGEERDRKNR